LQIKLSLEPDFQRESTIFTKEPRTENRLTWTKQLRDQPAPEDGRGRAPRSPAAGSRDTRPSSSSHLTPAPSRQRPPSRTSPQPNFLEVKHHRPASSSSTDDRGYLDELCGPARPPMMKSWLSKTPPEPIPEKSLEFFRLPTSLPRQKSPDTKRLQCLRSRGYLKTIRTRRGPGRRKSSLRLATKGQTQAQRNSSQVSGGPDDRKFSTPRPSGDFTKATSDPDLVLRTGESSSSLEPLQIPLVVLGDHEERSAFLISLGNPKRNPLRLRTSSGVSFRFLSSASSVVMLLGQGNLVDHFLIGAHYFEDNELDVKFFASVFTKNFPWTSSRRPRSTGNVLLFQRSMTTQQSQFLTIRACSGRFSWIWFLVPVIF
jgi:hypothetical protein